MDYVPPTPVSPNLSLVNSSYTTYTRPSHHHRKRNSALRLSSDTTSTLPEYTNPNVASITPWRTVSQVTETDEAPPGYSSDSAQDADEDTDISDEDRRKHSSVFLTVGVNSASPPSTPRNRPERGPSHRRKRSNLTLDLGSRSNSDLYLDSLLERSVHALEMSNTLLQSSISTKTTLTGILNQETDEEDRHKANPATPSRAGSGSGSGIYSLERSARGLSSRIMKNRDVHETWVEDLEQISRDVDELFSEGAQQRRRVNTRRNGSGSGSSQGSISASLPAASSPLQTYRHGFSQPRVPKRATRRASLELRSGSQLQSLLEIPHSRPVEHSERHDDMAGVPHLRYDLQDRERFISRPPRALTQYVVAEGNLRHGHEEGNITSRYHYPNDSGRRRSSWERDDVRTSGNNIGNKRKNHDQKSEVRDDEETITLPSTLGLRTSGTFSTFRASKLSPSRSRSRSPPRTVSYFVHRRESGSALEPSSSTAPPPASRLTNPSSSPRAPNAYHMLSSFVYPSLSSSPMPKRSNSTSSISRIKKGKNSPLKFRRGSANSAVTEKPMFEESNLSRYNGGRRHSTSPAASTTSTKTAMSGGSGSSSTVTAGSGSRSRSQTPKPLAYGFTSLPAILSGKRNMTPPLEVSSSEGGGKYLSSTEPEGSEDSSDSCPTKQTILSLRKILDTHDASVKSPSDDWTLISKPPRLLQQSLKVGVPAEAGTSTATASISKLFTRGVHSHEGSVTRLQYDEQRLSSFKGKGKASANDSVTPSASTTPTTVSPASTPRRMTFGRSIPELLSSGVALGLGAPSPRSSEPSSGTSTPSTPGHSKRISFAQLPEGTQGAGPERKSKKRKGKRRISSGRAGRFDLKTDGRKSNRRQNGSDDEEFEPKGWLGWLVGLSGVDSSRPDRVDERLGKGWGSRGPGYGGGLDEWGI